MESPRFKVKIAGKKQFTVAISSADLVQWDLWRIREGLPSEITEVQNVWAARVCYTAAIRNEKVEAGMPWAAWMKEIESTEFIDNATTDPTGQAAAESSS